MDEVTYMLIMVIVLLIVWLLVDNSAIAKERDNILEEKEQLQFELNGWKRDYETNEETIVELEEEIRYLENEIMEMEHNYNLTQTELEELVEKTREILEEIESE